jgi:type II secretory pathway pseudopilin PulG
MHKFHHNSGFGYLALLFFVATMGIVLAAMGVVWSTAQQRVKEVELLFVGNQFRMAITSYYESTPGTVKRYPKNFDDMMKDNRQLATVRHLRRVYVDPMTGKPGWGIIAAPDGGIMGVYSLSVATPLKRSNFRKIDMAFENAEKYAEWWFLYDFRMNPSRIIEDH